MDFMQWLTGTKGGEFLWTILVSMVPVIELRGGVPFGTALGLAPLHALVVCIIGNMIPIPFIIVYIRRIFQWMRRKSPKLNSLVDRLEAKGAVRYETGRARRYFPAVERSEAARAETESFLSRVYGGSLSKMVLGFVESGALSSQELEELKALVNQQEQRHDSH